MAPATQKAAVIGQDGKIGVAEVAVPKPGPGQILVKVVAAAQNPTDWKSAFGGKCAGAIVGCDYAGIVEEIGPDVPAGLRSVGERVSAFVHGSTYPNGSFSEYLVAPAEVTVHLPDSWSFEDGAQIGVAPFTAAQTLWETFDDLPNPLEPATTPIPILVYGASSSVGQYVVQFAKLSGLKVFATASPKNHALVKSLGADEVFDYHDPEVGAKIKAATGGKLTHAVDCIAERRRHAGHRVCGAERRGRAHRHHSALLGKSYEFPYPYTVTDAKIQQGKDYAKLITKIVATGKVKPNPLLIMPKGLASVAEGLQLMYEGKVSGQKITYRISDTP
ncbi:hypothetical protein EWM64_g7715 [Hericium alpestre]|uniref:Enoyl reductase (ER) domain-containing protein n=1 Tax=Hericium alpestre TaxID=135208 RepID=A0A4Y9ZS24_9AGAM|nr:hypothetical protein EWM64_g7715 [Hericium alpestre]